MNISNYYWYFKSALTPKFCDDIIQYALQQKEVMAEAKSRGYDTRIMRKIVSLRKRDLEDIAEEEAILSMYKTALGMN